MRKNKTTIHLPFDVERYISKKLSTSILICVISEIFILIFISLFGNFVFNEWSIYNYILSFALLMAIPVFATKLPKKLSDKSWIGEIVDINIKTTISPKSEQARTPKNFYYTNHLSITIRLENGYIIEEDVMEGNLKHLPLQKVYQKGYNVAHIRGTKHLCILSESDKKICVICGTTVDSNDVRCPLCGHSIIRQQTNTKK